LKTTRPEVNVIHKITSSKSQHTTELLCMNFTLTTIVWHKMHFKHLTTNIANI